MAPWQKTERWFWTSLSHTAILLLNFLMLVDENVMSGCDVQFQNAVRLHLISSWSPPSLFCALTYKDFQRYTGAQIHMHTYSVSVKK